MADNNHTQVASAFIEYDGKYLVVFDPKFKFWRVPGGRIEPGEAKEDTIKREMSEELDIEITVEKYLGKGSDDIPIYNFPGKTHSHRDVYYHKCRIVSGKVKAKEAHEVSEIKWLTIEEIKKIDNLEPAMRDYFSNFKH